MSPPRPPAVTPLSCQSPGHGWSRPITPTCPPCPPCPTPTCPTCPVSTQPPLVHIVHPGRSPLGSLPLFGDLISWEKNWGTIPNNNLVMSQNMTNVLQTRERWYYLIALIISIHGLNPILIMESELPTEKHNITLTSLHCVFSKTSLIVQNRQGLTMPTWPVTPQNYTGQLKEENLSSKTCNS